MVKNSPPTSVGRSINTSAVTISATGSVKASASKAGVVITATDTIFFQFRNFRYHCNC
jgi:hypothetical protein